MQDRDENDFPAVVVITGTVCYRYKICKGGKYSIINLMR